MRTSNLVDQSQLVKPEGLFSSRNWQHEKRNASMSYDVCVMWQCLLQYSHDDESTHGFGIDAVRPQEHWKFQCSTNLKKMQACASRKKIMCMKSLAISWTVAGEQRHFLRKITLPNGSLVHSKKWSRYCWALALILYSLERNSFWKRQTWAADSRL